jgi:gamma-glutamyl:cysteine ligase YbdK (ATP-grasp superfamily)
LLTLIREDAEYLDCKAEVDHARTILARGTSADRQLALYRREVERGLACSEALKSVVDELVIETVADTNNASCHSRRNPHRSSFGQLRPHGQHGRP